MIIRMKPKDNDRVSGERRKYGEYEHERSDTAYLRLKSGWMERYRNSRPYTLYRDRRRKIQDQEKRKSRVTQPEQNKGGRACHRSPTIDIITYPLD